MKRIIALLMTLTLSLALFSACGETNDVPSQSKKNTTGTTSDALSTQTKTETNTAETATQGTPVTDRSETDKTDTGSDTNVAEDYAGVYNPNLPHMIITHNQLNDTTVVMDLNKCGGDWSKLDSSCVVWEYKSPGALNGYSRRVFSSDAKYRWSEYYQRYVVIGTSSSNWAGIVDYATGEILWEVRPGACPHSMEMLPNGDVVVAGSGGNDIKTGKLFYYPISAGGGTKASSSLSLSSAHGVCWDPEENVLWALYYDGIAAVNISGYGTKDAKMKLIDGMGAAFPEGDNNGHDLSPVYGTKTKYWCTGGKGVWQFDTETNQLTQIYKHKSSISTKNVKGIAYFADETIVLSIAGNGTLKTTQSYNTHNLRILHLRKTTGKVESIKATVTEIPFTDMEFYKVHTFTPDYH